MSHLAPELRTLIAAMLVACAVLSGPSFTRRPIQAAGPQEDNQSERGSPGEAVASGPLPSGAEVDEPPVETVAPEARATREMLHLLGISASELQFIQDRLPVEQVDREVVYRLLHRLGRFEETDVVQWTSGDSPPPELWNEPARFRGALFKIDGRVAQIRPEDIPESLARRYGFSRVFWIRARVPFGNGSAWVVARHVPQSWLSVNGHQDQPVRWNAMFVTLVAPSGPDESDADANSEERPAQDRSPATPVWVADWTSWYPDRPNPELRVEPDHVLLGSLGADMARLRSVAPRGQMTAEDAEALYPLLAAVARADAKTQFANARDRFDLKSFLGHPADEIGRLYALHGTARRAVKIGLSPEHQERYGLTHYYEIDVFVPLETLVRFVDPDDPNKEHVFQQYPIVFCTPRLPEGMPEGDFIHQPVRLAGFYYKLWAYRTPYMSESDREAPASGGERLQVSPLLVGSAMELVQPIEPPSPVWGIAAGITFCVVLGGIGLWVWWTNRQDRQAAARRRELLDAANGPIST